MFAAHVRYDVTRVCEAIREIADVGEKYGVRTQISHLASMASFGQIDVALALVESYRVRGVDISCDSYPYDAFSTRIGETTYDPGFLERFQSDYDRILICDGPYAGQRCTAELFETLRRDAPETMTVGFFFREDEVEKALLSPRIMLGSDGLLSGDKGHPRAAGSFPRFIARYAKTGKLPLPEAIAKMTSMPAERLNLSQKGNLSPGADADIVIFDEDTIYDRANFENPLLPPEGIETVLIGGAFAVKDGILLNDSLGHALRAG
jgi:N-acyl-D-amino-acid deacylase